MDTWGIVRDLVLRPPDRTMSSLARSDPYSVAAYLPFKTISMSSAYSDAGAEAAILTRSAHRSRLANMTIG